MVDEATELATPGACATSSFDSGPYVAPAAASDDAAPGCRGGDQALRVIVRNGMVESAKQDLGWMVEVGPDQICRNFL